MALPTRQVCMTQATSGLKRRAVHAPALKKHLNHNATKPEKPNRRYHATESNVQLDINSLTRPEVDYRKVSKMTVHNI